MNSEVLIVGGGVIGLSIARELKLRGVHRIAILDRRELGREASWAAAGMLAPNIETDATEDFHRFGCESLELYPEYADALFDETGVDIELDRAGTICVALHEKELTELDEMYSVQRERNVPMEYLSRQAVHELEPGISDAATGGLYYPNDWQVENRKLLDALQEFARRNDIRVIENVEVIEIVTDGERVRAAKTTDDELAAGVMVLATGAWTSLIKIADAAMPVDVTPVRGQMISYKLPPGSLRHVIYGSKGYLVPRWDGRILAGATVEDAGFEAVTTATGVASLETAAAEIFPGISSYSVTESWAGLRPLAADGLPILGAVSGYENLFVATAHYRNGILLAPRTAEVLSDRIVDGNTSEILDSFSPDRFAMRPARR
jgi:glycine oxidase